MDIQAALQDLPRPVRRALYWIVAIVGLLLSILQAVDVKDIGPVTMEQALKAFALVSPFAGFVAVANVSKPAAAPESAGLGDLVQDMDLSAFEPVGATDDVYGYDAASAMGSGMGSDGYADAFAEPGPD